MLPYGIKNGTKIHWIKDQFDFVGAWYVIKSGMLLRTVPPNAPSRAKGHKEDPNPYKKVWNSVEDEESYILDAVKNGTLFVPTAADMARRDRASQRYWEGRTDEIVGELAAEMAAFHAHMAETMEEMEAKINSVKRPKHFSFTVKED